MAEYICRDIFNAVYANVKRSYVERFFTIKVKSKTSTESATEDESLKMNATTDPTSETNTNLKETSGSLTETVRESVERKPENEFVADVRLELEEKFPFALGSVCGNLAALDRRYRAFKGYDEQGEFSEFFIDVVDDFPLSERFIFPCIMYVTSMMLIDVDERCSDDFYDKYASAVSQIDAEIPFESKRIVEKYPY